jgi:hypothetical protein
MELGIHIVNFNLAGGPQALGPTMAATARAAEQGGATMFPLDRRNPRRRGRGTGRARHPAKKARGVGVAAHDRCRHRPLGYGQQVKDKETQLWP